jgi:hypothetical protein
MKKLLLLSQVSWLCFIFMNQSFSEEIQINTMNYSSCEIFPFDKLENITRMKWTGSVRLLSDTSLVRIILTSQDAPDYMIFEAYPLIVDDSQIDINAGCDETCYLNQVDPVSVKIQIINAELSLKSLFYYSDPQDNLPQLQYEAKRYRDEEKVDKMNSRIPEFGMQWQASDNNIVSQYYYQKKDMFGEVYNLEGFEYYHDGVFEFSGRQEYPRVSPDLVWNFDWRDRHGANDSLSPYWNGDFQNTGWLTRAKQQGSCQSCWAFASVGLTEALANLYTAVFFEL